MESHECGFGRISAGRAQQLWDQAEAEEAKRAAEMPTEQDAIKALWNAYQRLRELGWNDAIYCPKDGSEFDAIEAGSSGIHRCHYTGEWPDGHWWVAADGDLWPSRPILYRPSEEEKACWAKAGEALREAITSGTGPLAPPSPDM
jgi:hypothetical protein